GRSVRRREDERLLRGQGLYVADVRLPEMLHVAVLRSPHAHARLRRLDARPALARPGVVAALTFLDLAAAGVPRLPMLVPHPALNPRMPYPLADERVLYVGEPVAVVVAGSGGAA